MDKTTELLSECLTMLCDKHRGYQDRELHRSISGLIEEAREHLKAKGIDGEGAWSFD